MFSLIELFPGPEEAGSARQSSLIFLNDVASVSVNHCAAAARHSLLWLTSQRDKQPSLLDTDEGTITSTLPKTPVLPANVAKKSTNKPLFKVAEADRNLFHSVSFLLFDFLLLY